MRISIKHGGIEMDIGVSKNIIFECVPGAHWVESGLPGFLENNLCRKCLVVFDRDTFMILFLPGDSWLSHEIRDNFMLTEYSGGGWLKKTMLSLILRIKGMKIPRGTFDVLNHLNSAFFLTKVRVSISGEGVTIGRVHKL